MAVERVEHVSFFSAIMQSIRNVLGGGVLLLLAFPLLFWNECSAVKTARSLTEGAGAVVTVAASPVDPGNDGRLVHVTGEATTADVLTDPEFGASLPAIKLSRSVEMYQWKENKSTKTEGSKKKTTYTYQKTWSSSAINSSAFEETAGHLNPGDLPYESTSWAAKTVTLGGYSLSADQLSSLSPTETLTPESTPHTVHDGWLYLSGSDPGEPEIGDVRVRLRVLPPGPVTVIAAQSGATFAPYATDAGKPISMISAGTRSSEEMFEEAQQTNVMWTWIIRFGGFMAIFMGLSLVLGPLRVVADRIPLLGRIFSAGLGLISFLVAAALSTVTIAAAWIAARPLLGVILLLVGGGAMVGAIALIAMASAAVAKGD